MTLKTTIIQADLNNPDHHLAVLDLIDKYAQDPMGNGKPLNSFVRRSLIPGLKKHPTTIIFLAYYDSKPAGIAVCFTGFSTFSARPLLNIHDFAVLPAYRSKGIARKLMQAVERKARDMGCCKLTLEVQENNTRARHIYESAGFGRSVYQEASGAGLFLVKKI